jgi:cytochrome P450
VQIAGIRAGKDNADEENTVFHKILVGDMPDSEKSGARLREEAYVLVVAGTETTAGTLAVITYQLLSKPAMFRKLKAELEIAMPDPNELPLSSKLEGLPYLVCLPGATLLLSFR